MATLERTEIVRAVDVVENILSGKVVNVEQEIQNSAKQVPGANLREYFNHMNTLFLNVLLNRQTEFGEVGENRSIEARRILAKALKQM